MNQQPLYDLSSLIAISRGNEAFVEKMIMIFCYETPVFINEMLAACEDNHYEKMGDIAHKLKPSIDNLKILSVKEAIRDIEKMGHGEKEAKNVKEIIMDVQSTLLNIIATLKVAYQV